MLSRSLFVSLLCGLALVAWSCQAQEEGAETGEMEEMGEAAAVEQVALPDTSGAAVWDYLETVDFAANWELWPDKGELYVGQEPHGALLTTYLNPAAHEALTDMAGAMPTGAIIVKENYMPDSTLAATTVMYKVDGFDPEHGNWYWLKVLADGTIEVQGRGAGCIACHSGQADNDYIFTGSLGGGEMGEI
ncbi:MAG: cytochrome P460 family protein [Gemmatimonadales bacterium]